MHVMYINIFIHIYLMKHLYVSFKDNFISYLLNVSACISLCKITSHFVKEALQN